MNNASKKTGPDTDLRGLLKHHHRRVYSICRLFANNYREHQRLFVEIIAAASQNIRFGKARSEKQILLLRACINMAALHSIRLDLDQANHATDRALHFKSPDFQRSMVKFRESIGEASDLEKFRLFLELEKVPAEEIAELTGVTTKTIAHDSAGAQVPGSREKIKKNFIPYLKEKLIWS
jgi:DNA-directed RNA polymerase specialized sigma24 family protein